MKGCMQALTWYRAGASTEEIANEFKAMEQSNERVVVPSDERKLLRWIRLFVKPETRRPLLIVATLLGLIPQTGIFSVTYFAMELFSDLGFADATVFVAVSASSLRALGSIIAGIVVVYKGRRVVLMFSCVGAILCIELATLAMMAKAHLSPSPLVTSICDYVMLISIPSFMFFLGIGMTPVPWILLGEWFVSETRSFTGGLLSSLFSISALVSLQVKERYFQPPTARKNSKTLIKTLKTYLKDFFPHKTRNCDLRSSVIDTIKEKRVPKDKADP